MVTLGQTVATNTVHKPQHSFVALKLFILFVGLGLLLSPAWDMVGSTLSFCDARGQALEMLWFPPMEFLNLGMLPNVLGTKGGAFLQQWDA